MKAPTYPQPRTTVWAILFGVWSMAAIRALVDGDRVGAVILGILAIAALTASALDDRRHRREIEAAHAALDLAIPVFRDLHDPTVDRLIVTIHRTPTGWTALRHAVRKTTQEDT